jgi:hypothetical protein
MKRNPNIVVTAREVIPADLMGMLEQKEPPAIDIDRLRDLSSNFCGIVRDEVSSLKDKRTKLHELERQEAQKRVELVQAKLGDGGDIEAKQSELDALNEEIRKQREEVEVLMFRIGNIMSLGGDIVAAVRFVDPGDNIGGADFAKVIAANRVANTQSDDDEFSEESSQSTQF